MVTYSPRTEVFKLRIRKRECNPEMFGYDSIKEFSVHDSLGLPKMVGHRPDVRIFQGNNDPLGIDAEFIINFLITYVSSSFCLGLLEACMLGNWVTVFSWTLNTKDWAWIYSFWLVGQTSSGKLGSNEHLAFILLLTFEYNPQDIA